MKYMYVCLQINNISLSMINRAKLFRHPFFMITVEFYFIFFNVSLTLHLSITLDN